jgi:sterol desaturase/sphingolipid hydroxylase (fatty acid hydroxylase superfamily)
MFKTFIEISGHAGTYNKNSSFNQCIWIPKLFGIELYARDHYIHHEKFDYNYAKRFTIWDKAFGTYKTDDKIIKKENILFNKKSIVIKNEYIKYGLFFLFIGVCYLL